MRIAVTGSTGLIGGALCRSLVADGHEVRRLVRRRPERPDEVRWDPLGGSVDIAGLSGIDATVHLAGAGVGDRRWSSAYKQEIRDSRVVGTQTLVHALTQLDPVPRVLVSGSAIGWYGDSGERVVDESDPVGAGFLAEVVGDWESAADPARIAGIRVVHPRTGLVVAARGGAWGRLWPLFRLGLGGRLGPGTQYWSFVSLRDEVAALRRMIDDEQMAGAYNVTAPTPATNAEVTAAMGRLLHRPTFMHVPTGVLRAALGEMSQEVLGSTRAVPTRLIAAGFTFADVTIESALESALSGREP